MTENAEQDGKKDEVKDKKENEPSCSPYPTWIDYAIIDNENIIGMREDAPRWAKDDYEKMGVKAEPIKQKTSPKDRR